ncbi:hypothetical protein N7540_003280 [Penicillium herquei]|nr:hypothetical protein N7540_003280 [Penicillium herquei]
MSYSEFHFQREEYLWESAENALRDDDGTRLYENDDGGLRSAIIRRNDIPRLKQYLSVYSPRLDIEQRPYEDTLYSMAGSDHTEVVRVLLDYYNTNWKHLPLHEREYSLLTSACDNAQVETARLIIDSQPALNSLDQWYRDEALLAAATSLGSLLSDSRIKTPAGCYNWVKNRVSQAEELIHLLLDNGASVQTTAGCQHGCYSGTVLGQASSRARPALIKRLIEHGADVHGTEVYPHTSDIIWDMEWPSGVTAFHISSVYGNSEALQTLLDHSGRTALLYHDSYGRLPLHWAAAGPGFFKCWLPDEIISKQNLDTLKLLCSHSDIDINVRDNGGKTPLHLAMIAHAGCGQSIHFTNILRFFLEKGAYAGLVDDNNQTVLHMLAFRCLNGDTIDKSLIQLLISNGAEINQQDSNGNTALHLMARNLRQIDATQFLTSQGADVSLINVKGNTALHECLTMGAILPRGTSPSPDRRKALDEMVNILLHAGGDAIMMMDQTNQAGETPRQLQSKKLASWQKLELREPRRK